MHHTLVLGSGWLGNLWRAKHPCDWGTARSTRIDVNAVFDLARIDTWYTLCPLLERTHQILWTFPPASNEKELIALQRFSIWLKVRWAGPIIVWSTTSIWGQNGLSYEQTPVLTPTFRWQGEQFLMQHHNATILHLSGLFGPGRSPLTWLLKKQAWEDHHVHLVHADNILHITEYCLKNPPKFPKRFIVTAPPVRWSQIIRTYQTLGLLSPSYVIQPFIGPIRCLSSHAIETYLNTSIKWKRPGYDESLSELQNIRRQYTSSNFV